LLVGVRKGKKFNRIRSGIQIVEATEIQGRQAEKKKVGGKERRQHQKEILRHGGGLTISQKLLQKKRTAQWPLRGNSEYHKGRNKKKTKYVRSSFCELQ